MKTHKQLYSKLYNITNLYLAYKKARKSKTKKQYVIEFEKDLWKNLLKLQDELKSQTYKPKPLQTFILRDPKTRKISKSDFRDRIIHHALCNIIEPIFDKTFIYDSCANRKGKGNLFAIKRFELFMRKVTSNLKSEAFCLKADIRHYFEEVKHKILLTIIYKEIKDEGIIWLIKQILENHGKIEAKENKKGMPLGNLTSQFFANVYLNELDYFIKHELKSKYYVRYVDDFVILCKDKEQLRCWKKKIDKFLKEKLKLELHPDKSRIVYLPNGLDFVGFRNFYYFKLLRERNIKNMLCKIEKYKKKEITEEELLESFQGWYAYAKWASSFKLIDKLNHEVTLKTAFS